MCVGVCQVGNVDTLFMKELFKNHQDQFGLQLLVRPEALCLVKMLFFLGHLPPF